ncbi:ubiquinone biosynthesis O-methyltransferase, mitochondrial isoform X2 [Musca domestica]|uniref:Ubiquinone biosynthesis O-methyltransferase, mitochondrial n=1 Tax=Musca domestica TaxID=7370 RepID=A0A9J7IA02_MUSDO|nr:ubiquinone biosynthesis O-methyltransferase, mitochondrial isoform X2 [Musca domestica]
MRSGLKHFNFDHDHNNMSLQFLKRINLGLTQSKRVQFESLGLRTGLRKVQTNSDKRESVKDQTFNLSEHTKSDVKHHSNLAIDWWNVTGPMRALHSYNKLRVPFICDGLQRQGKLLSVDNASQEILKNQKILEIGCGGGILTENLASLGANVTGLDLSENLIALAQGHLSQQPKLLPRIQYRREPIELHAHAKENFYDAVVISEVLEHIDDKISFLTSSISTVKPGGSIFITTLNKTISMWLVGVLFGEYVLQSIPIGTHQYNKMISPADVERILKTMNCDTVLIRGSSYNFFRNTWRWTDSTSMFYALHAVKK